MVVIGSSAVPGQVLGRGWRKNGIYFRDSIAGSDIGLSPTIRMGSREVCAPGGAEFWISRRQTIAQSRERILDPYRLGRFGGDECISYRGRAPQRHAQIAHLV